MSAWMNDAVSSHNGNGFPHMTDPNATGAMMDPSAFMSNPAQFNQNQFANQPQPMAGIQNGPIRHGSPTAGYQAQGQSHNPNPGYQTTSVIPSKRPRPREDSISGSPRQNPGMQPPSRSETPQQQSFTGFQSQQNPGQYPHLQPNGSANASPSPIMGNQMRPVSVPQRVATASPHPFSPGAQQFGSQTSPVPSEHGTPQPNTYMQGIPPGYNPGFAPSPSNPRPLPNPNAIPSGGQMMPQHMSQVPQHVGQMPPSVYQQQQQQQQQQQHVQQGQAQQQQQQPPPPPPQQQQQRPQNMTEQQKMATYQMRLQQQLQGNMQMQAQMQAQSMGRGVLPKQQMPGVPNGHMPQGGMRPQPRPMANINPEHFMKNLAALMNAKGLPFDPSPVICDRPIPLVYLFQAVQSRGGHKMVTASNGWHQVAQTLGLPMQNPTTAPTLKQVYERNLQKFEEVWTAQQKQRMQQSAGMVGPGAPHKPMPPMGPGHMHPGQHPHMPPQQQQQQAAAKPGQAAVNGFPGPQPQQPQQHGAGAVPNRSSLSGGMEGSVAMDFSAQSPVHHRPTGSLSVMPGEGGAPEPLYFSAAADQAMSRNREKTDEYMPCSRELLTYGGIDVQSANMLGMELDRWNPFVPSVHDLGNIDIHALTRSLQCGIHGEVRLALDTLAAVSSSPSQMHFMQLRYCDDLIDVLMDCADQQLDLLAEHTVEESDEILLQPYEDVVRACRLERWAIKEVPAFGSTEHDLDRAVDRLICITTILRNFSFPGEQNDNHNFLSDETVTKMICVVIRYLGTRTMLLRTHRNTLDFMKDVVILLSNIASSVELPGREQALCLLHFLLSFAPTPGPTTTDDTLFFPPYEPDLHTYTPHAVDALAKLLARDEPNRGLYKVIFAADANGPELLTRTFAMAISPILDKPDQPHRLTAVPSRIEHRKPFLMQGLLVAEILASLAPGAESDMARSWLASGSGLAQNLYRIIQELSVMYERPQVMNRPPGRMHSPRDPELVYIVVLTVGLLKRLIDKAGDTNSPTGAVPGDLLPQPQLLVNALTMQSPDWTKEGMLLQLTAIFKHCQT
ncbi:hypothetical protein XA68_17915 [Ophiocordyceps unilateralis]|uniref:ARID domain-containing protein n=1 Tax=Ophiocordyceps unilateralis TaxID=268505 RepID=A0A2A9P444_OPHUN|nr:hypothetical protein XA68_17915 [Ophiocordyceps unilateralis]